MESHTSTLDNLNTKTIMNKSTMDGVKFNSLEPKTHQRKQLSQIKFQKVKKSYGKQNIKKI